MRYELTWEEWAAVNPMLSNKPRGVPRQSGCGCALMSPRSNVNLVP